jgi:hypothetical protein
MLHALEKIDRSRAATVLSLAARKFLPRPGDDRSLNQADESAAADLIKEISTKAVSRTPQSTVDKAAVQEELSREISSYLLSGVDPAEVRTRVGDKGALSPSLYKVSFSPKFEDAVRFWGVSKAHVLNAIAHCDEVQHFGSRLADPKGPRHSSLFSQIPPVKGDRYTILVGAQRKGDTLIVDDAYRVYHNEVDLIGATSPLDILRRFLEKFGEETEAVIFNEDGTIAQSAQKRLFHDVVYYLKKGQVLWHHFPSGNKVRFDSNEDDTPFEMALCYSVSAPKYVDQLRRHGVKAEVLSEHQHATRVIGVPPPSAAALNR